MYDTIVEKPVKPCKDKPWQGLVAQVDRVLLPAAERKCENTDHTPETCNCGCRDPSHTPRTCTCGNSDYKLPIIYNSRYDLKSDDSEISQVFSFPDDSTLSMIDDSKKSKREATPETKLKQKRRERLQKLKPLRKVTTKELKAALAVDPVVKQQKPILKAVKANKPQQRPKRGPGSPCSYTYESCDPKRRTKSGCPLCYRCKCEPSNNQAEESKFSPYDLSVPYKMVRHEEAPGTAPKNQEFDYEPSAYVGLKDRDMYKKYIQQVVAKYPEFMARRMPDVMGQEQDLLKFIDELSKADKSAGDQMKNEDTRYQLVDNAMDMYRYYERAMGNLPKVAIGGSRDAKYFKKRGTVLEVIELDPDDFNSGSFKIADQNFEKNVSESQ